MDSKIVEKLRKLINHQQSAAAIGSENEANAFAEKIQSLLDQNNLSMSDVEIGERQKTMSNDQTRISVRGNWESILMHAVADVNGVWFAVSGDKRAVLVGEAEDIALVKEVYSYFHTLAWDLGRKIAQERRDTYTGAPGIFRNSFVLGFSQRFGQRLRQAHRENLEAATQSTALIYIGNKLTKSTDFAREQYRNAGARKMNPTAGNAAGYFAGREQANNIGLNHKTIGGGN